MIDGVPIVIEKRYNRILIKWLPCPNVLFAENIARKFLESLKEVLDGDYSEIILYVYPEVNDT